MAEPKGHLPERLEFFSLYDGIWWWPIPLNVLDAFCRNLNTDTGHVLEQIDIHGEVTVERFTLRRCDRLITAATTRKERRLTISIYHDCAPEDRETILTTAK